MFFMLLSFIRGLIALILISFSLEGHTKATQVSVIYPKQEALNQKLTLTGSVEAQHDAALASLEQGVVNTILVEAGDHVTQGQVLLTLDNTLAKIELEQAKATHLSAQIQFTEAQRLHEEVIELAQKQVVANTLLAERKANKANSQALLARATAELTLQQELVSRHVLIAPFTGVIAQRNVDIGEWVTQQNTLFQLVSDTDLRLVIDIPQEYVRPMQNKQGFHATISSDIDKQQRYTLPLSQVIAISDPLSRTVKARINLPQSDAFIPGMSARAELLLPQQSNNQFLLPKSALKRHPDGSYSVFTVVDNKVKRYRIVLIENLGQQVSVSGIPEKSAVIVSGAELLSEGTLVDISLSKGAN